MIPTYTPITPDNCATLPGPFYHGTRARLAIGDLLTTGHATHFEPGRGCALKHVYFSAQMEPAIWGAELAVALSGEEGRGHIYIVETWEGHSAEQVKAMVEGLANLKRQGLHVIED